MIVRYVLVCDCISNRYSLEAIPFTDVEDVKFVINFDYPSNSEDYVHRIGRTGRSDRTGTAYTFFTPSNANKAADLVAVLKEAKQVINPKLQEMAEQRSWGAPGRGNISVFNFSMKLQTTTFNMHHLIYTFMFAKVWPSFLVCEHIYVICKHSNVCFEVCFN